MSDGQALLDFLEDMRRLRRECPWKREQTHRSLARYLQEETAETLEAIDTGDLSHLREELGDLLLQVYFHAVIAEETDAFTMDDVATGIRSKMHRRNPHVFGSTGPTTLTAAEVDAQWQAIKATEKARTSPYDGIAPGLSALLLATKVLERTPSAAADLTEPTDGSADLGDRLLALVAEATSAGIDPEQALRDALRRAVQR
ncbi:MAG TPA: MazG family protein [Nocardioides sp.]|uniref:MazG family protein n=1 Tax=Nocardioides sp. TaxID=35761 RepID=UPI002F405C87